MILAVVLAPTDAALGQAVVTEPRVPQRIRQGLNVESGLNDGICAGERGAGGRDDLLPRGRDQVPPPGLLDDAGDQQAGHHAAQDAVTDLLEQQRAGAAAAGDLGLDVGDRDGREQQR